MVILSRHFSLLLENKILISSPQISSRSPRTLAYPLGKNNTIILFRSVKPLFLWCVYLAHHRLPAVQVSSLSILLLKR